MPVPTMSLVEAQTFIEEMDAHIVADEFGHRVVTVCSISIGKSNAQLVHHYHSGLWSARIWYPAGSAAIGGKGYEEAVELYTAYAEQIIKLSEQKHRG